MPCGGSTPYWPRGRSLLFGVSRDTGVSTHFVVAVSESGFRMLYGHGEDQGTTHIRPSEVRALKAGAVGPPTFTAWLLTCEIRGRRILMPIRLSHTSSDFLTAEYQWARQAASDAYALLSGRSDGSE